MCVAVSAACTESSRARVCGKRLDDDLSGYKNTISCLLWWMGNTRTTHTMFSISKLSLWLSTAQPCRLNSESVRATAEDSFRVPESSVNTHGCTHTLPRHFTQLYTAGEVFTQQEKSLRYSDGQNEIRKARGRAGSPLSQFEQQANEITQVVVVRLANERRGGHENYELAYWHVLYVCMQSWVITQKEKQNKSTFHIPLSLLFSQLIHPWTHKTTQKSEMYSYYL